MKTRLASALALAAMPALLPAQTGTVVGEVRTSDGVAVGAEVRAVDGPRTLTDDRGRYRLQVAAGAAVIRVTFLGYATAQSSAEVGSGETVRIDFELEPRAMELDPVVVTGTMRETRVSASPVKVDVVSGRYLQRSAASSLAESIRYVNGLYEQVDCAVCYTNSIRINGMDGPYTAVLIDGMPIMGALASVYGLNGIDPSLIEQLEILKGPQSTLYGTEALGGVVNVITKDPRFAPRWSLDASRTSLGEATVRFAATADGDGASGLLSGAVLHGDRFVDENGDGFSDLPLTTRVSLFGKGELRREGRPVGGLTVKAYREERFGGVASWTRDDVGSSRVYGEFIRTSRVELMGRWRLPVEGVRLDASYAYHDQESYYGDQRYLADQQIGFGRLVWSGGAGAHQWLTGLTLRARAYDDDTPATATAERRLIPGLFVEDEWRATDRWTVLGGVRADHHGDHGLILSPRLSAKWQPLEATTLRANAGTGFRVVNLFTEDHAALTGARRVVIEEALAPERSVSLSLNVNQVIEMGPNPMMIDLDLFHTRFGNRIRPDYETDPNLIVYRNLDGHSVSRGVSLSLNQNFLRIPLRYTAGITFQDVHTDEGAGPERELFAPEYRGVWSISYTFPGPVTVDWTGSLTGPMRMPSYPEPFTRPTRSPVYTVHNLQATWEPAAGVSAYATVKNVGDMAQASPLIAPDDPFGEAFDTNYVWGPIVGRQLVLGVRVARGR
ncbi:MAG: TonB-dependent receptor [Longimicrobiales bacterium]|nr:TonB-dependent receptor [Longimicrobiales bacterium]